MSQLPSNPDQNTNSDNSNNSSINNNDSLLTAVIKAFESSTSSSEKFRRGLIYFILCLLGFGALLWIILDKIKPDKVSFSKDTISIEAGKAGSLTVKEDNKKTIIMVLTPNGGTDDEWVNTEIEIKKGDTINIIASGKINVSLAGLIKAAQDDVEAKAPWNDPEGLSDAHDINPLYPERGNFKTMKQYPFGRLIAAIKKDDLSLDEYQVGKQRTFHAENDGKLLLTINDIWLSPKKKDAYLPPDPTEKNRDYYRNEVLSSISSDKTVAQDKFSAWNKPQQDLEIMKKYNERKEKWDKLTQQKNYGLWYQDNVGSFAVTITIESEKNASK
ncbi:hypothetical protein H6G64_34265 [Calothrix sp. FACHB-156]|nr:hypothetical protein [Calothrix sp. FACHB-156]